MCLAVPGRVVELLGEGDLRTARVDFGGVVRQAQVGDYVLVHVGFAISRIDEKAARETFETLAELGQLELPGEA